ncbi:hypothetical protein Cni_G16077 [Canna indica]|uniref:MCAfunc domain-containing protein n=1 Tax=Canna indica TaxID=4628 RepID=A0AAQ3KJH0_9LILI|nr:hypothetical protein Cni_G16077 [Canna indica]
MVSPWAPIGNVANVTQLVGLDAITIIAMIIDAAENARMHKKNCRAFAEYLELISNLLVPLNISELRMYPETSAPLDRLEDVLRRSHFLVSSCCDRSFPYLLAKGWIIKQHFKKAEVEIE